MGFDPCPHFPKYGQIKTISGKSFRVPCSFPVFCSGSCQSFSNRFLVSGFNPNICADGNGKKQNISVVRLQDHIPSSTLTSFFHIISYSYVFSPINLESPGFEQLKPLLKDSVMHPGHFRAKNRSDLTENRWILVAELRWYIWRDDCVRFNQIIHDNTTLHSWY